MPTADHYDVIIIGSGAGGGTLAYRLALGRRPEPGEIADGLSFVKQQATRLTPSAQRSDLQASHEALVDFCHVLLNSNEFLYVD